MSSAFYHELSVIRRNKQGCRIAALFLLTEVGRSPPGILHLLEERHDLVDHRIEGTTGIFACLDHITTQGPMLEEHS